MAKLTPGNTPAVRSRPRILSAPKAQYVAALRAHASRLETESRPNRGQLDLFESNVRPPDTKLAQFYRENAEVILRAPGQTTQEVYKKAEAGVESRRSLARRLKILGTVAAVGALAGFSVAGGLFLGSVAGAAVKVAFEAGADSVAGTSQKYCDRVNAIGQSVGPTGIAYGDEGLIAEANSMAR